MILYSIVYWWWFQRIFEKNFFFWLNVITNLKKNLYQSKEKSTLLWTRKHIIILMFKWIMMQEKINKNFGVHAKIPIVCIVLQLWKCTYAQTLSVNTTWVFVCKYTCVWGISMHLCLHKCMRVTAYKQSIGCV